MLRVSYWLYGEDQVFLFFIYFFLENIIETNCKAAVTSFYLITMQNQSMILLVLISFKINFARWASSVKILIQRDYYN